MEAHDINGLIEFLRFPSASGDTQFKSHLEACADWLLRRFKKSGLDAEKIPTIFLVEGEEETGSPHFEDFLRMNITALAADIVVISDKGMVSPGSRHLPMASVECFVWSLVPLNQVIGQDHFLSALGRSLNRSNFYENRLY